MFSVTSFNQAVVDSILEASKTSNCNSSSGDLDCSYDVINETADWWINNMTSQRPRVLDSFWMNDSCKAFEFFLSSVAIGVLGVIGLCWNVMTIIVLIKDKQNEVASFLLQVLAVADSGVLVISLTILSAVVGPAQIPWVYRHLR